MQFNHVANRLDATHFETVVELFVSQLGFVELRRTERAIWLRQPGTNVDLQFCLSSETKRDDDKLRSQVAFLSLTPRQALEELAAWLTQRSIYERPKDLRKGVWIDEAFFLSEVPTGRVLMNRFARDSRKWNVRVLLSSQIPADFLRIQGFVTLLDSVFVGRLDDEQAQADALRLLKVAVGAGYEQVIASLGRRPGAHRDTERDTSPRQFVFGDGAGGVERIRIDLSGGHLDHVRGVLDTTPDALREGTAATVLANDQHAPVLPDPDDADGPPTDGSVDDESRALPAPPEDEDFELAADHELGLTEDDLAGEIGQGRNGEPAPSPRPNPRPPVDQRGNGSGGDDTSPDGGSAKAGKRGRVDAA